MAEMKTHTYAEETLSKHLKRIKASGGNKAAMNASMKNKTAHPESAESLEKLAENLREDKAKALRNDGNSFYKDGHYPGAHIVYTKSIGAACKPLTKAMAYANRSAALHQLGLFADCTRDVDQAIAHGYPLNLQHVLLMRKARCYQHGSQQFWKFVKEAQQSIKMHNQKDEEKLLKVIDKDISKHMKQDVFPLSMSALNPNYWTKLPLLSYGENKEVPWISSAVSIAYSKQLGRHLVANQDIQIGDVLVVEPALCHSLTPETAHLFCSNCLMQCFSAISCNDCEYAFYCSKECLDMDLMKHKNSCKLVNNCFSSCGETKPRDNFRPPEENSRIETNLAFTYRLISLLGQDKILQHMSEPAPDWKQPTKYLSKSSFSTLVALLNLTDHMGKVNCKEMNVYSTVALQTASSFGLSLEKRNILAAAFLKLILVTKFNNKNITHLTIDYMTSAVSINTRIIGSGLYLVSSFINHSCIANTTSVFYGTTAVFRAIKPIKAGEQLTHEYIASIGTPASTRQDIFNSLHNFSCTCHACKEGWSIEDLFTMNGVDLARLLNGTGLNNLFWINFLMELNSNTLFNYGCYEEQLKQIMGKFITDGKERCLTFFNLVSLLKKHMAMQGNATLSSLAHCLLINRTKDLHKKFEFLHMATAYSLEDFDEKKDLAVPEEPQETGPQETGAVKSGNSSAKMLKLTLNHEELEKILDAESMKRLENLAADAEQASSK